MSQKNDILQVSEREWRCIPIDRDRRGFVTARDLRPCVICKGPATVEQIDSSIGVLVCAECADTECNGHWNNGWFQDEADAVLAWNHRQIGEAAMNAVLPFEART